MIQVQEGKRYVFLQRLRSGSEQFTALVTSIDVRDGYKYVGYRPDDLHFGRWGFFKLRMDGAICPYGVIPIRERD